MVVITIYYAVAAQTDSTPLIPACSGYRTEEGKKYIAVSRDLLQFSTPELDALKCGESLWELREAGVTLPDLQKENLIEKLSLKELLQAEYSKQDLENIGFTENKVWELFEVPLLLF